MSPTRPPRPAGDEGTAGVGLGSILTNWARHPGASPGSDFIAFHNTLITDAILTTDAAELVGKCQLYEHIMRSIYESLLPTYAVSYDALGDQETYVLKYTWELSIYFAFFVFPFINDLSTHRLFALSYLGKFSRLGSLNAQLQAFISAYYQWKKGKRQPPPAPLFHDFTALGALRAAESTFYRVGVSVAEARGILDEQLTNLRELARHIVAYVSAVVLADEPTGELDSQTARTVVQLMRHLNQTLGQTFLVVSHDPMVAEQAQRVVRLRDGRIESDTQSGAGH